MDRIDDMSLEGLVHSEKMVLGCYIDNKKRPLFGVVSQLSEESSLDWIDDVCD